MSLTVLRQGIKPLGRPVRIDLQATMSWGDVFPQHFSAFRTEDMLFLDVFSTFTWLFKPFQAAPRPEASAKALRQRLLRLEDQLEQQREALRRRRSVEPPVLAGHVLLQRSLLEKGLEEQRKLEDCDLEASNGLSCGS